MKYSQPIWKMVLDAAREIEKEVFAARDIVEKVHEKYPEVPAASIGAYVIAMAPNHPSSPIYVSTHKLHRYFEYLGDGKYRLKHENRRILLPVKPRPISNNREEFLRKHRKDIISWAKENKDALILGRRNYGWNDKSLSARARTNVTVETMRQLPSGFLRDYLPLLPASTASKESQCRSISTYFFLFFACEMSHANHIKVAC